MSESLGANFSIDISRLRAGLKEANQLIRESQSQFKKTAASLDDWAHSEEGLNAKLKSLNETSRLQSEKVSALRENYNQLIKDGMSPTSNEASKLRTELNREEQALTQTQKAIAETRMSLKELGDNTTDAAYAAATASKKEKELTDEIEKLNSKAQSQQNYISALKKDYVDLIKSGMSPTSKEAKNLKKQIDEEESSLAKTEDKIKDSTEALGKLSKSTDDAADAAEKASNGGFTVMKGILSNLATDVIRGCISELGDFAKEAINVGMTFDSSMSQVGAVSGATGDDLEKLREKAKEMGSTTKFTASEAADAFNYMAMAGWKTEDMLGGIDGILNLAAASGTDLATTSDIVTDALTAMGYSAKDAGKLADVMAAASSNANTNVEMMGQTFQYAAPIVGALGYDMEDTAVAIGLMANAGIKGEKAGTALRSIMTRMSAPPKEAAEAMAQLGLSITDSSGKMKPLDTVIGDLRKAFDGMSESEQAAYAKHLAGQEAMSGLLAIVNAAPSDFEKLTKAVENSNGAAEQMSETMMDNLGGDITILQSAFEGLQLTLFETANGAMRDVVQEVTNGIIPALTDLINGVDGADYALGESISKILESILNTIIEFLPEIINVAGTIIFQLATGLVMALPQLLTAVGTIVSNLLLMIGEQVPNLVSAVVEVIPLICQSLVEAVPEILKAAVTMLMAILQALPFILTELVIALPEIISTIVDFVLESIPLILASAIQLFLAIVSAIPQIMPALILAIPEIIGGIFDGLVEGIPDMIDAGKELLAGLFDGLLNPKAIWEATKTLFNNIIDNLKDLFKIHSPSKVMEDVIGKNLALGIGEGFDDNIGSVNKKISDAINFDDPSITVSGTYSGGKAGNGKTIVVNQYNNYSQAHSRYEIYKSKQQTAAAVRLASAGA